MSQSKFFSRSTLSSQFPGKKHRSIPVILLCCVFMAGWLAACGSTAAGQTARPTPTPTLVPTPTPTPTPKPTPIPTPKPTPTPVPPPPPPPPPPSGPTILDVRPSSMSLVGHLDCRRSGSLYFCTAEVIAESGNGRNLSWFAFANFGDVGFSPASGVLAPGQGRFITITVGVTNCGGGLFFFRGPANTHTISWNC